MARAAFARLLGRQPSRRSFSVLLSRLRSEGLVERRGSRRYARWTLTRAGRDYRSSAADSPTPNRDGVRRLVIFDIPEHEKPKREAIRRELIRIGYEQFQKSVWMGEFPLPADFVEFIQERNLQNKVHIFSVSKPGTIMP